MFHEAVALPNSLNREKSKPAPTSPFLTDEFKIISHTAYVMSASTENFESDKNPGKNSALYIDTVIIFNVLFWTVTYTVADFLFLSQTKGWYML